MKPYTYLVKHKPTGLVYYGFRSANAVDPEQDLWNKYYTSSPGVKQLIEQDGIEAFDVQIRKTFNTQEQAVAWETKVLRRMRVLESDRWINQNIAGYVIPTAESNAKISAYHKGKPKTEEHKRKIAERNKGQDRPWAIHNLPKDTSGENNGMFNKKHTLETKRKISEAKQGSTPWNVGVPISEEQKQAISVANRGRKMDPADVARRAAAQRGAKRPTKTCPHCGTVVAANTYARWHGDRCKNQ
jgi:hypothetical protein